LVTLKTGVENVVAVRFSSKCGNTVPSATLAAEQIGMFFWTRRRLQQRGVTRILWNRWKRFHAQFYAILHRTSIARIRPNESVGAHLQEEAGIAKADDAVLECAADCCA
jgi:hypothetical protein